MIKMANMDYFHFFRITNSEPSQFGPYLNIGHTPVKRAVYLEPSGCHLAIGSQLVAKRRP